MRALEARLRRLEAKLRPESRALFLALGRSEEEASERASLARATGEVGPGDVVVMAAWPQGAGNMPASRWAGRIEPAEFDVLAQLAQPIAASAPSGGREAAAYFNSLSDAQLVVMALGRPS